jgi:hypothetical protein
VQPKSAFVMPEDRWLVEAPAPGTFYLQQADFFRTVGSWRLDQGLALEATGGSMFVFDFGGIPEAVGPDPEDMSDEAFNQTLDARRARVELINAFALCLHSAGIELEAPTLGGFRITHEDLVDGTDFTEGYGGPGMRHMSVAPGAGYVMPFSRHFVCTEQEIARACELLDHVLETGDRAPELVALLNESLDACRGHNFGLAVVTAWTVCEVLIQQRWDAYTQKRSQELGWAVNRDRRKFWQGRDFTASIVTEILTLAEELPIELHPRLSKLRKKRNEWAHDIAPVHYVDAVEALAVARDALSLVLTVDLNISPRVAVSI